MKNETKKRINLRQIRVLLINVLLIAFGIAININVIWLRAFTSVYIVFSGIVFLPSVKVEIGYSLKIATGCDSMESLEDINDDDIVIIVTQHDVYKDILNMNPLGCKIIDTFGLCRELRSRNDLEYYEVGCNAAINEVGSKPNKRAS